MARIFTDPNELSNSVAVHGWTSASWFAYRLEEVRKWGSYGGLRSTATGSGSGQCKWTSPSSGTEYAHVFVKTGFFARSNASASFQFRLFDDTAVPGTATNQTGQAAAVGTLLGGTIKAYRGTTEIADSGVSININQWYLLEAEIYLHDTNGVFKVWLDKELIIDFSGDTLEGTTKITRVAVWGQNNSWCDDGPNMNNVTMRYENEASGPFTAGELIHAGTQATGTLTLTGQPNDGDQVDINGQTYTFNTVLGGAGSILIGAAATNTIDNLIAAINDGAGEGSTWGTGTPAPNADVTAAAGTGDTMDVTSINYGTPTNSITTTDPTDTSGNLSWGAGTLGGATGSGATAYLTALQDDGATGVLTLEGWNGTNFVDGEQITGGTSSATADVDAPNAAFANGFEPNSGRMYNSFNVRVAPNANGATSGLTNSAGNTTNNYLYVDEVAGTLNPTTYVEATAVDQKDTYKGNFTGLIPTGATIQSVGVALLAQSDLSGIDGIKPVIRNGGSDYDQDRIALATGHTWHIQDIPVDPSIATTSDQSWTRATLVGAGFEFGQKFVS